MEIPNQIETKFKQRKRINLNEHAKAFINLGNDK